MINFALLVGNKYNLNTNKNLGLTAKMQYKVLGNSMEPTLRPLNLIRRTWLLCNVLLKMAAGDFVTASGISLAPP